MIVLTMAQRTSYGLSQSDDNRIWFRILERNGGVAVARNLAIEQSSGEYIVTMDSDDVSLPTRLEKQLSFLQENPNIDVVGTWKQAVDENLKPRFVLSIRSLAIRLFYCTMFIGARHRLSSRQCIGERHYAGHVDVTIRPS